MIGRIATVLIAAGIVWALAAALEPQDQRLPSESIAEGCKREFGPQGEKAEFECNLRLLNRWAAEQERAKNERAYSAAR